MNLNTPILFIIYNRADLTERILNVIREVKPMQLFIAADGPKNKNEDERRCIETRNVIKKIDWECNVMKLYSNINLGCKIGESTAMNWFFNNVTEGIILEDDTLPNNSFFSFCEQLLDYYRNDKRISMISGNNFQFGIRRNDASYYFSKITHTWGWASWKRAWQYYDVNMRSFSLFKKTFKIKEIFDHEGLQNYYIQNLQNVYDNRADTWDFQWTYSMWLQNGLCVIPNINLVKNIGFRWDATHTRSYDAQLANMSAEEIKHIIHPSEIIHNTEAEVYTYKLLYTPKPIVTRAKNKLRSFLNKYNEYSSNRNN